MNMGMKNRLISQFFIVIDYVESIDLRKGFSIARAILGTRAKTSAARASSYSKNIRYVDFRNN